MSSADDREERRMWRRHVDHLRSQDRAAHGALKALGLDPGRVEGAKARLQEVRAEIARKARDPQREVDDI